MTEAPVLQTGYPHIAVITGADSGIGKATAVALAEKGFDVGITFHTDQAGAERTADEVRAHGRGCAIRGHDLSEPVPASAVVDELADELGGLGVLVNNAGAGSRRPFLEMDYQEWRSILAVDLDGPFLCSQRAGRQMAKQGNGGRIVNVTSVHEEYPGRGRHRVPRLPVRLLHHRGHAFRRRRPWPDGTAGGRRPDVGRLAQRVSPS